MNNQPDSIKRDPIFVGMDKIVELCSSPGKYVYQYRDMDTAFKMLNFGTIRLNPLEKFNDPTEVARFNEISLDGTSEHANSWDLLDRTKRMHQRFRVACFSQDRPEALKVTSSNFYKITDHFNRGYLLQRMWAQYGDNHKGICLAFDQQKLDKIFKGEALQKDLLLSGPVKYYLSSLPLLLAADEGNPTIFGSTVGDSPEQHISRFSDWFFFNKQDDWSNEREFRWVYTGKEKLGHHLDFQFADALEAIIVGDKFPIELYPKIKEYCLKFGVPCLRVFMSHSFPCIRPANMWDNKYIYINGLFSK
jgi:hypothetical protein